MATNRIHLLSEADAHMLAAQEVINRPACIVKELMENALDAGATKIDLAISHGGKSFIQVEDNGCGMSAEDAVFAFERHATSKIQCASDLQTLMTMGFRGEAMPSIASVSKVVLKTRQAEDELGTCVIMNAGKLVSQEPVMMNSNGTTVRVENIFSNIPARRRFLKDDNIEKKHIINTFLRIALIYPDVEFTFSTECGVIYNLCAVPNMMQRITDVYRKLEKKLIPVKVETDLCTISGYVGTPDTSHEKNVEQYFFANGRFIEHNIMRKAVSIAYDHLLPQGKKIPFFIHFAMNPKSLDVNCHPQKKEVKFEYEKEIFAILTSAVRDAIGKHHSVPMIDFTSQMKLQAPDANVVKPVITQPMIKDVSARPTCITNPVIKEEKSVQMVMFEDDGKNDGNSISTTSDILVPSHSCIQYNATYIITTTNKGLMVVNQERAHERILFERYMSKLECDLEIEQKGLFDPQNYEDKEISIAEDQYRIALNKARKNGVAQGQILNNTEMNTIISDLMKCENSRFTPTGEPIYTLISNEQFFSLINVA